MLDASLAEQTIVACKRSSKSRPASTDSNSRSHHKTPSVLSAISRCSCVIIVLLSQSLVPDQASADQLEELATKAGIRIISKGESSSELEKKTASSIPLNQLLPKNRERAQTILNDCNQYRRLPTLQYAVDESMYRYLLQNPDVAVSTWRVMGISRFEMWQTGPQEYEARAVDGSEGLADILYQDKNQLLFICEGMYHNPLLLRPLEASALIWFRANYTPHAEGTHVVSQRADVFVRFPSNGLSAVAKVLTPVTNTMMDRNLFEISLYSSMMSRAVRDEPEWVIQVAQQLEGVLPQRRRELVDIARLPRTNAPKTTSSTDPGAAKERQIVMSPQLQFFDPPKDESNADGAAAKQSGGAKQPGGAKLAESNGVNVAPVPGVPVTSKSPVSVRPVSTARPIQISGAGKMNTERTEKPVPQSDDEFALQPVVPPAGSTATVPAGSSPTSTGPVNPR